MILINRIIICVAFCFVTCVNNLSAQSNFIPPATSDLINEINRLDSILFETAFITCDMQILKDLLAPDLEFYHDKWGIIATSSEQFLESINETCESQRKGLSNKAKREIIKSSIEVFPLSNYGAIHRGDHIFFQEKKGKFEFTESGKFTHLWNKTDDGWKLTRILSYDHKPTRQ